MFVARYVQANNTHLNREVDVAARLGVDVDSGADLALLKFLQLEALVLLRVLVDLHVRRSVRALANEHLPQSASSSST